MSTCLRGDSLQLRLEGNDVVFGRQTESAQLVVDLAPNRLLQLLIATAAQLHEFLDGSGNLYTDKLAVDNNIALPRQTEHVESTLQPVERVIEVLALVARPLSEFGRTARHPMRRLPSVRSEVERDPTRLRTSHLSRLRPGLDESLPVRKVSHGRKGYDGPSTNSGMPQEREADALTKNLSIDRRSGAPSNDEQP